MSAVLVEAIFEPGFIPCTCPACDVIDEAEAIIASFVASFPPLPADLRDEFAVLLGSP